MNSHIDRIYGIVGENGLISETITPFWNKVEVEVIRLLEVYGFHNVVRHHWVALWYNSSKTSQIEYHLPYNFL
jgi:hypothetical protein